MENTFDMEVAQINLLIEAAELYMKRSQTLTESADIQVLDESVKETFDKIIEKIKELVRKLVAKIRDLCNKFLGTTSYTPDEVATMIKNGSDEGKNKAVELWKQCTSAKRNVERSTIDFAKVDKFIDYCNRHFTELSSFTRNQASCTIEKNYDKLKNIKHEFTIFWGTVYHSGSDEFENQKLSLNEGIKFIDDLKPILNISTSSIEKIRGYARSGENNSRDRLGAYYDDLADMDKGHLKQMSKDMTTADQDNSFTYALLSEYSDFVQIINMCVNSITTNVNLLTEEAVKEFKEKFKTI